MSDTVIFGDVALSDLFSVVEVKRTPSQPKLISSTVPGRLGSVAYGRTVGSAIVAATLIVRDSTAEGRRAAMRQLRVWLDSTEPLPLYLPDDGGAYMLAMVTALSEARYVGALAWGVTWTIPEPYLYSPQESTATGLTVHVGGDMSVKPRVTISGAVRNTSINGIAITDELGHKMQVPLSSGTHTVVIDCADDARTAKVDGALSMITTSSDWFEFTPGNHTMTLQGTGTVTTAWRERWMV